MSTPARRPSTPAQYVAASPSTARAAEKASPRTESAAAAGAGGQVRAVGSIDRRAHAGQRTDVGLVDAAPRIGRHVQQQLAVAADRSLVEPEQGLRRLHPGVLGRAVEPAGADRHVALRRNPVGAEARALAELVAERRAGHVACAVDERPRRQRPLAALVADPADVRPRVAEHHGVRLQPPHRPVEQRPVVDLPLAVRPFAVGAVEPDLEDRPVVPEHLLEHRDEHRVVLGRAVGRVIAVPRREVDAELQPGLAARVGELADARRPCRPSRGCGRRCASTASDGQRQKPSWCLAVRITPFSPASLNDLHPLPRVEVGRD